MTPTDMYMYLRVYCMCVLIMKKSLTIHVCTCNFLITQPYKITCIVCYLFHSQVDQVLFPWAIQACCE